MAKDEDEGTLDMSPDLPADVAEQFTHMKQEIETMMEKIEREHGKAFTDGVTATLTVHQMQQILVMAGAPRAVLTMHAHLAAQLLVKLLTALGKHEEQSSIESHALHIIRQLGDFTVVVREPVENPTRH